MTIKLTVTYLGITGGIPGLNNHSFQSTKLSLLLFGKYSYKNFLKSSVSIEVYLNLFMYALRNGSNASEKCYKCNVRTIKFKVLFTGTVYYDSKELISL
jgi:hypothetical protein